jgi:hypothetical protein
MYKLWINVDVDGNIVNAYGGYENFVVEPVETYDYYFEVTDAIYKNIRNYKLVNGELILN